MENLNRQLWVKICSKSVGSQLNQQMKQNVVMGLTGKWSKEVNFPRWHRLWFWITECGRSLNCQSKHENHEDRWYGDSKRNGPHRVICWSTWFPAWWNHLGRIRWCDLAGECVLLGTNFEVLKETHAVPSPIFLPRGCASGWELWAVPSQILILWNHKPN